VALGSFRAYPNGFEFTVHVRTREEDDFGLGADPFELHGRPGPRSVADQLRLGLEYADGPRGAATAGPGGRDSGGQQPS